MKNFDWSGKDLIPRKDIKELARLHVNKINLEYVKRKSKERRESGVYDKICENCGKQYHAFRTDQKFCSMKCRAAFNNQYIEERARSWAPKIREIEGISKYGSGFVSHHILPASSFPDDSLEIWNGVQLPEEWHKEFHAETGGYHRANDPFVDWAGKLFKFIEHKIQISKLEINTLDDWF